MAFRAADRAEVTPPAKPAIVIRCSRVRAVGDRPAYASWRITVDGKVAEHYDIRSRAIQRARELAEEIDGIWWRSVGQMPPARGQFIELGRLRRGAVIVEERTHWHPASRERLEGLVWRPC